MAFRYSQLIGLRDYTKETKERAANVYRMLQSFEIADKFDLDISDDGSAIRFDDFGWLCDEIVAFCNEQLQTLDGRLEAKLSKRHNTEEEPMRTSRWF